MVKNIWYFFKVLDCARMVWTVPGVCGQIHLPRLDIFVCQQGNNAF